jgi:hypothetical protein
LLLLLLLVLLVLLLLLLIDLCMPWMLMLPLSWRGSTGELTVNI